MSTLSIILIIAGAVLAFSILSFFAFMYYVSWRVYQGTLVRTSKDVWGRACSEPENEEQLTMWERGLAWASSVGVDVEQTAKGILDTYGNITDLRIENDGFTLFGQYIDLGFEKAVIIIPGRCESLMYSYYFAKPYQDAGYNILVIDIRCHGLSSGKYDFVGIGEDADMMAWARILKDRFGNKEVLLHGICMGGNAAILATLNEEAIREHLFAGMVLEGPYVSFRESFKEHLVEGKHPVWPLLGMVMHQVKKHTGCDVDAAAPIHHVGRLTLPVLILAGKSDIYSVPEKTEQLFAAVGSPKKDLIWFSGGSHSHLRITDEKAYDTAIVTWLNNQ